MRFENKKDTAAKRTAASKQETASERTADSKRKTASEQNAENEQDAAAEQIAESKFETAAEQTAESNQSNQETASGQTAESNQRTAEEHTAAVKMDKKNGQQTPGLSYTIAKYVILAITAVFIISLVLSQRKANIAFEEVTAQVEAAIDTDLMRDVGAKGFNRYYGLNSSEYDGVLMYQSTSGMSADEILLVKVKDAEQIEALTEAIESRRESRINDFSGYAPEEAAVMEDAELITAGRYVLFLPYSEAEPVKQAFLTAIGD